MLEHRRRWHLVRVSICIFSASVTVLSSTLSRQHNRTGVERTDISRRRLLTNFCAKAVDIGVGHLFLRILRPLICFPRITNYVIAPLLQPVVAVIAYCQTWRCQSIPFRSYFSLSRLRSYWLKAQMDHSMLRCQSSITCCIHVSRHEGGLLCRLRCCAAYLFNAHMHRIGHVCWCTFYTLVQAMDRQHCAKVFIYA